MIKAFLLTLATRRFLEPEKSRSRSFGRNVNTAERLQVKGNYFRDRGDFTTDINRDGDPNFIIGVVAYHKLDRDYVR